MTITSKPAVETTRAGSRMMVAIGGTHAGHVQEAGDGTYTAFARYYPADDPARAQTHRFPGYRTEQEAVNFIVGEALYHRGREMRRAALTHTLAQIASWEARLADAQAGIDAMPEGNEREFARLRFRQQFPDVAVTLLEHYRDLYALEHVDESVGSHWARRPVENMLPPGDR